MFLFLKQFYIIFELLIFFSKKALFNIRLNFSALKHSPSKRKSIVSRLPRPQESDFDSTGKFIYPNYCYVNRPHFFHLCYTRRQSAESYFSRHIFFDTFCSLRQLHCGSHKFTLLVSFSSQANTSMRQNQLPYIYRVGFMKFEFVERRKKDLSIERLSATKAPPGSKNVETKFAFF